MYASDACQALKSGRCLEVRYHGFARVVEVHAVGTSTKSNPVMRVWQVRGGSVHNERVGWKLLLLDEGIGVAILDEKSLAPCPGYKRGDKDMIHILCQL